MIDAVSWSPIPFLLEAPSYRLPRHRHRRSQLTVSWKLPGEPRNRRRCHRHQLPQSIVSSKLPEEPKSKPPCRRHQLLREIFSLAPLAGPKNKVPCRLRLLRLAYKAQGLYHSVSMLGGQKSRFVNATFS